MNNKWLSLLVTITLIVTLIVPVGAVEQDDKNTSDVVTQEEHLIVEKSSISEQETNPVEETPTEATAPLVDIIAPTSPTCPEENIPEVGKSIPTMLYLDSKNTYANMDMPYEEGYIPKCQSGVTYVVLPIICNGKLINDEVVATLRLGAESTTPFVMANYEKRFSVQKHIPQNSTEEQELYLIEFGVELKRDRVNGIYPVVVEISGFDLNGVSVNYSHTVYVTIVDGVSNEPIVDVPDKPTAEPVLYIADSSINLEEIAAGSSFELTVTLKNSLDTKEIKNILVTVSTDHPQLMLDDTCNILLVDSIEAGDEKSITIPCKTKTSLPAGKYNVNFSFKYDTDTQLNLLSNGVTSVEITQPAYMQLVNPRFPDNVMVGETITMQLQVINMGRGQMNNVRCVVNGYGIEALNVGYIGTMLPGSSALTEVDTYIVALNTSEGNYYGEQYGETVGSVTLFFEDENDKEYSQQIEFNTVVNPATISLPAMDTTEQDKQEMTIQWWIAVLILGGVIVVVISLTVIGQKRKSKYKGNFL